MKDIETQLSDIDQQIKALSKEQQIEFKRIYRVANALPWHISMLDQKIAEMKVAQSSDNKSSRNLIIYGAIFYVLIRLGYFVFSEYVKPPEFFEYFVFAYIAFFLILSFVIKLWNEWKLTEIGFIRSRYEYDWKAAGLTLNDLWYAIEYNKNVKDEGVTERTEAEELMLELRLKRACVSLSW